MRLRRSGWWFWWCCFIASSFTILSLQKREYYSLKDAVVLRRDINSVARAKWLSPMIMVRLLFRFHIKSELVLRPARENILKHKAN
jgi:hypothetical protein